MRKRCRNAFLIFGVLLAVCAYLLFSPVITAEKGVVFYVRPGVSKKILVNELAEQGVIKHPMFLYAYIYFYKSSLLKTGEYLIPKNATLYSIWQQFITGKGHYYRAFTIVPGWSFAQLSQQLNATNTLKHLLQKYSKEQIMLALSTSNVDPEGQFYPETYYYTRDVPDLVILQRAHDLMQVRLNEAWEKRSAGLPYRSAYEVLIVASLVEKEAYLNSERKTIAGVIINRLNKNMLLQIDPTVIYGMGENYHGVIHKQDLLTDTIYNTYTRKGLPPTPIAMPSQESLNAAAQPENNDYLYFVTKGAGAHQFSKTLAEHNAAVDLSRGKVNEAR